MKLIEISEAARVEFGHDMFEDAYFDVRDPMTAARIEWSCQTGETFEIVLGPDFDRIDEYRPAFLKFIPLDLVEAEGQFAVVLGRMEKLRKLDDGLIEFKFVSTNYRQEKPNSKSRALRFEGEYDPTNKVGTMKLVWIVGLYEMEEGMRPSCSF
jgi:hypothetical protein